MSLRIFYRICVKGFKRPTKNDLCPLCEDSKEIKKTITSCKISFEEKAHLKKEYEIYEKHKEITNNQTEFKNHNDIIEESECIIVMDFEENMKSGGGKREISRDLYNKSVITVLEFCLIYKTKGINTTKYISYLSESFSHDSLFVKNALAQLLKSDL